MKYATRDFGEMEIADSAVLEFAQPPFGFEQCKKYALLYDSEIGSGLAWLQSLEDAQLCFLLLDPTSLAPGYTPGLPAGVQTLLGEGTCEWWVIMTVRPGEGGVTVNLKSPVCLNLSTNRGAQVMLEQDYPVRFPLSAQQEEG